jgi:opacity protein-like surface antigen
MPVSVRLVVFVLGVVLVPGAVSAQGLGVGARFAMVRPDVDTQDDSDRYTGVFLRTHMSPRTAFELSLDWRTVTNEDETLRTRAYPIQASLLLYPFRTVLAPYVLGGVGWYSRRVQALADGEVTETATSRDFGFHAGFGAQLWLGRHAAVNLDYRYTRVEFGGDDEDETDPGAEGSGSLRVPVLAPLAEKMGLSHQGSMWTAGLSVYF